MKRERAVEVNKTTGALSFSPGALLLSVSALCGSGSGLIGKGGLCPVPFYPHVAKKSAVWRVCVLRCSRAQLTSFLQKHTLGFATREKQTNTVSFPFLIFTKHPSFLVAGGIHPPLSLPLHFDHRFYLMLLGSKITPWLVNN